MLSINALKLLIEKMIKHEQCISRQSFNNSNDNSESLPANTSLEYAAGCYQQLIAKMKQKVYLASIL